MASNGQRIGLDGVSGAQGFFWMAEEGEKLFGRLDMSILGELLPYTATFLASWRCHTPLP